MNLDIIKDRLDHIIKRCDQYGYDNIVRGLAIEAIQHITSRSEPKGEEGKGEPLPAGQRLEVVSDEYPRVPLPKTVGGPAGLTELQEAGGVILDLCSALESVADVEGSASAEVKAAWGNACRWMADAPLVEAPKAAEAAPPRPVLKSEGYPHSLDDCIRYMDLLAIEGIATGHNERVGGMCLSTAKHLERLKELESEARSAPESPRGSTPDLSALLLMVNRAIEDGDKYGASAWRTGLSFIKRSIEAAPQGVEARPMDVEPIEDILWDLVSQAHRLEEGDTEAAEATVRAAAEKLAAKARPRGSTD